MGFVLRYLRIWTLSGCFGWHDSFMSHGGWGRHLWSGRLGLWFPIWKRGTGECAPFTMISHSSASTGKFISGCCKCGSNQWSLGSGGAIQIRPGNSGPTLYLCWGHPWGLPIQPTCALWTWRRPTTMSLRESCGGHCRNMGYWGCKIFGPPVTKVKAWQKSNAFSVDAELHQGSLVLFVIFMDRISRGS